MKRVTRDFAIRIGVWSLLATTAVTALAETPITSCPFNITAPGNYILNADLTCVGAGITITASNVSLNLNGRKITLLGVGTGGVAIRVNGQSAERVHHVAIQGPGLIVMGAQGRGGAALGMFGSTTLQVVRAAACPVLTVHGALP